ncbi:hypothetical protein BGX26_005487 [Mortierella sp. AD094]|nr:hypothetical protein BGX26_005487 [Mortierella sp. AD094]
MEAEPSTTISNGGKQVAVVFIGNSGAGKSTLLSQIGGNFASGARFRRGYTEDVSYKDVDLYLNDEKVGKVVLIDVPGLFEPDANNSGPEEAEVCMMATVGRCVKQADGSNVPFRVIINQVMEDRVQKMNEEQVANDKFKGFFEKLRESGTEIDVDIEGITLIRFNK